MTGLLHDAVRAVAARHPRRVAVRAGADRLTYRELDERSRRLAGRLREAGLPPGGVVGVPVDKAGTGFAVAALATWQAGGAYLPLDPAAPPAHTEALLAGVEAAAVLHPSGAVDRRSGEGSEQGDPLAYIVHTSGSTGVPKPVAVGHRALLDVYGGWRAAYGTGAWLQAAGPAFDVHVGDLARALLSGGRLVPCPAQVLLDPPRLAGLVARTAVDMLELTPTVWRLLAGWCVRHGRRLPPVRLAIAGGERLTGADLALLRRALAPGTRIINSYGVAEAGIDSTYHDVDPAAEYGDDVPIGRPFPGVGVAVLDGGLRPVPDGVTGELYLAGRGLAHGYHRRPALTAGRFLPAVPGLPGRRMYRTGDLVRRRPDGELVYVGRTDDEVKIRGARVSLGAVEAALRELSGVSGAVAVREVRAGEEVLVAHVTGTRSTGERLRAELAGRLPAPMVPVEVRVHERLPVGPTGKTDRATLTGAAAGFTGRTPAERAVVTAWRGVLGRAPDGPGTDLFAAGGTSLTAARLATEVAAATGADLPVSAVFAAPTVAGLARALGAAAPREPVTGDRVEGPLSPAQHALWLLRRLRGDDPAYHLPTLLHITGPLDVPALRAALDRLVARHDALRLSIVDTPALRLGPAVPFPLEVTAEGDPLSLVDGLARRPFDLSRAPLARGALLRTAPDRHHLAIVLHHAIADDWSERVLLRDLGRLYRDLAAGREPAPPAPAARYLDVAAAQAARAGGPVAEADRAYWRERLAGLPPPLELPAPAPGRPRGRPEVRTAWLAAEVADRVRATAARCATTPYVVLLAAFAALAHRWSGQEDLVLGAPFGHRDRPETQELVGFLVSTLPLRLPVPAGGGFAELVAATRTALAGASAHAAVPYERLVADAGRAGAGRDALFRVWFNWLGPPAAPPVLPGLDVEVAHLTVPGALFDLAVYVTDAPDGYRLDLVADPSEVDDRYLAPLLEQYRLLVGELCAEPGAAVSAPALRPEGPPAATADLRTGPPELGALLARAAAAGPHRIAVRDAAGAVSYAGLHARAGALATALSGAGVRPGDVVPVYAERSAALVPALLGVLGAGAAFTVLDAAHPAGRLAAQVAAAGAAVGVRLAEPPPQVRAACPAWLGVPGEPPVTVARPALRAGELACLAFTSGTGGRPKPVRTGTAPLANFLTWYADRFRLGPGDRFALLSGLGHDPLLRDVLAPLAAGAALCVPPPGALVRPLDLRAWLHEQGVTVLHLTPALARLLSIPDGAPPLGAVRLVLSAGDALYARDVAAIRSWAPAATLVNGYGTTETPQVVAFHEVPPGPAPDRVPIGTGAPGAELLVLDAAGRPAAVGERGTIVVRGAYLARSAGVVDDPVPGHHRFATGDLGRRGPDGEVTMLGRADDQVQLRGYRVELSEVDRCLLDHPDVRGAACRTLPGPDGEPRLVGYVVPRPGAGPVVDRLRAHVRAHLPEHMVPARLVTVPQIPLTPNRKPDRAALPVPGPEPVAPERPGTELERAVRAVWRRVLQVERVGLDQNFFDLGADSMLLIRAQAGLEEALARPVPVTVLFEHTTVRTLAAYLAGGATGTPAAPARREASGLRARRSAARRGGG